MPGTSESALEFLWDIVLLFFIVRTAFVYFLFCFASTVVLSYCTYGTLFHTKDSVPLQSPLLALLSLLMFTGWAKLIILYYDIPRVMRFRLAIGAVALCFVVIANFIAVVVFYAEGRGGWIFTTGWETSLALGALPVAFATMPAILMVIEIAPGAKSVGSPR
jgi:hypothetical protein